MAAADLGVPPVPEEPAADLVDPALVVPALVVPEDFDVGVGAVDLVEGAAVGDVLFAGGGVVVLVESVGGAVVCAAVTAFS